MDTPLTSSQTSPATSYNDAEETPVKRPLPPRVSPRLNASQEDIDWLSKSHDELIAYAKRQNDENARLAERVEETVAALDEITTKHAALSRDLELLQSRHKQSDDDRTRLEEDLADRAEVGDKLRSQLKQAERGRLESEKRYREQTASFDADRQSWVDAEKHLKARIANLSKASMEARRKTLVTPDVEEGEGEDALSPLSVVRSKSPGASSRRSISPTPPPDLSQDVQELQEQYDALTTSYDSLNKSHEILQDETAELKRINQALMETQEKYEVLLCERTLTGELLGQGVLSHLGSASASNSPTTITSFHATETSLYEASGSGSASSGAVGAQQTRKRRKKPESTLCGMDLAAELDRADETEAEMAEREAEEDRARNQQRAGIELPEEVDDLQKEVVQLRKANEALSLYVSRILEKIQASDAFESILVRQSNERSPRLSNGSSVRSPKSSDASRRARPSSIAYVSSPAARHSSDISSVAVMPALPQSPAGQSPQLLNVNQNRPLPAAPASDKQQKRMSITQYATSLFSTGQKEKTPISPTNPPAGFKPMLLGTSVPLTGPAPAAPTTRSLENEMDEEDLRERERLQAELKLWGADQPTTNSKRLSYASPSLLARSPPAQTAVWSVDSSPANALPLSRSHSSASGPSPPPKDALEREKEQRAGLEAGRGSGLTEIRGHRRRPSSQLSRHTRHSSAGLGISVEERQAAILASSEPPERPNWSKRVSSMFGA